LKYFTREWWTNGGEDENSVSAYRAYIASIKDKLMPDVARLAEGHLLHDASLSRIETLLNEKQLKMSFIGWDDEFKKRMQIELCFDEVRDLDIDFPFQQDDGESGIGDLGYYEIELLEGGFVEVRMLFSSSTEMQIVFRSLTAKSWQPG
jgi:Protein of unknown function (DUF4085)